MKRADAEYLSQFDYIARNTERGGVASLGLVIKEIPEDKFAELKQWLQDRGVETAPPVNKDDPVESSLRVRTDSMDTLIDILGAKDPIDFVGILFKVRGQDEQRAAGQHTSAFKDGGGWHSITGRMLGDKLDKSTVEQVQLIDILARYEYEQITTAKGDGIVIKDIPPQEIEGLNGWLKEKGIVAVSADNVPNMGPNGLRITTDSISKLVGSVGVAEVKDFVTAMNEEHSDAMQARQGAFKRKGDRNHIRVLSQDEIDSLSRSARRIEEINHPGRQDSPDEKDWQKQMKETKIKTDIANDFMMDRNEYGKTVLYSNMRVSHPLGVPSDDQQRMQGFLDRLNIKYDIEQVFDGDPAKLREQAFPRQNILVIRPESMRDFMALRDQCAAATSGKGA